MFVLSTNTKRLSNPRQGSKVFVELIKKELKFKKHTDMYLRDTLADVLEERTPGVFPGERVQQLMRGEREHLSCTIILLLY